MHGSMGPACAIAQVNAAPDADGIRVTIWSGTQGPYPLRDAIAASLAWRGVRTTAENVVVVPGAKPMLFYALLSILDPGTEVLVPDPGFPIYESIVRFAGAVPVRYPIDAARGFDLAHVAALVTPRTRALVLNLPGNPSGACRSRRALRSGSR